MIARLLVVVVTLCSASAVMGQENSEAPHQSFLGYLKPEMHIGMQSVEGTTDVLIHVYTVRQFEAALSIGQLDSVRPAREVAETNELVREELTSYLEHNQISEADKDLVVLVRTGRNLLGTVRAVGSDYVLVERANKTKSRILLPSSRIGAIYLDATPLIFTQRSSTR